MMRNRLVLALLATGTAVGFAAPASAELTDGTYTNTATESAVLKAGATSTWVVSSCGADCKHVVTGAKRDFDLHRDGNSWTETFGSITTTIDNDSLAGEMRDESGNHHNFQLSKNG